MDHYNSPIYGMLIHRRHLLQTLVRLLLKFASTVSMSILSVYTVSARARLYGLPRSLVLLLRVNHQATASQTNKLLENQCSPKHCRNFDCRTKIAFTVGPFIKGCTPPTPRVVQYTQWNCYDSSKAVCEPFYQKLIRSWCVSL